MRETEKNNIREKMLLIFKLAVLFFLVTRLWINTGLAVSEALRFPLGSADFQWDSAKLFSMRLNPYKETLYHIYDIGRQYEKYYEAMVCNQLPSAICLLLPWTVFDPVKAKLAWLISNAFFIIAISFGLSISVFKNIKIQDKIIWNLLWICSIPLLLTIEMGQHLPFAVAGFFISVYFSIKAYEGSETNSIDKRLFIILSGIFLAISYFKYTVTFITLLYFVYKKWWKPIFISAFIHTGLTVFSSFWIQAGIVDMFRDSFIISSSTGKGGQYDLMALMGNGPAYKIVAVLIMCVLLFLAFRRESKDDTGFLALLFSFSLILVYHRSYDFFVLIVPVFWMFEHLKENYANISFPEKIWLIWSLLGIWVFFFYNTLLKRIIPLSPEGWDIFYNIMTFSSLYMTCAWFMYREIKHIKGNGR